MSKNKCFLLISILLLGTVFTLHVAMASESQPVDSIGPFGEGNLVVLRIGDGANPIGNHTNSVFLDEYNLAGLLIRSINLPTVDTSIIRALTITDSPSEGMLSLSEDGGSLSLIGYRAPPQIASPHSIDPTILNRTMCLIDADGAVETVALDDLDGRPQSLVKTGSAMWIFNGENTRYLPSNAFQDTSVVIKSSSVVSSGTDGSGFSNFGSQLFISRYDSNTDSSRLVKVGLGQPVDPVTEKFMPGLSFSGNVTHFYFEDLNDTIPSVDVLYVYNETSESINKYSLLDTTWHFNGSVSVTGGTLRGLTCRKIDSVVALYYTTDSGICFFQDTTGHNSFLSATPSVIANCSANMALRGITFAPSNLVQQIRAQRVANALKKRRIIYNNDGDETVTLAKEVSEFGLLEPRLLGIEDSQVDAIFYCTGNAWGLFKHDTKIGTVLTHKSDSFYSSNLTGEFIAAGLDPLKVVTDFGHRHNKEVFWSFRINDVHDSGRSSTSMTLFAINEIKQAHPEFLVGNPFAVNWSAVNYLLPEVQEYTFRFLEEVCKRYDIDGIELDFLRHRVFFKKTYTGQAVTDTERDAMTNLMRRIRQMTEVEGVRRGRPILISMRVPDSESYSRDIGLDIESWLQEGLLDMMSVSSYIRLNPWEGSVALGHQYGVPVYPSLDESRIQDSNSASARNHLFSYRARAMNSWKAGVDGIYMFNFFKPRSSLWHELGDTVTLAGLHKDYFASIRGAGQKQGLEHLPYMNLPTLNPDDPISISPGTTESTYVICGDGSGEVLGDVRLRLRFGGPIDTSIISVKLRGVPLSNGSVEESWLCYDLMSSDFSGREDTISVTLSSLSDTVLWEDLHLQYRKRFVGPDPFGEDNLVILRIGEGDDPITTNANPVFLDEYSPYGTLIQSIPMPANKSDSVKALTLSNNSQEGMLTRSVDSQLLCFVGYNMNKGGTNPAGTLPTVIDRTLAFVDYSGSLKNCLSLNDLNGRPFGVVAADSGIWVGNGNNIRFLSSPINCTAALPSQTSQSVISGVSSTAMHVFDNQLYVSVANGGDSLSRVLKVGNGLPNGPTTTSVLPGLPESGVPFQFYFADLDSLTPGMDILYLANNTIGGIQKYSLIAGSWVHNGNIILAGTNPRGITGKVDGNAVKLYITSVSSYFSFIDSTGYNGALNITSLQPMASTAKNTAFRGIAFTPVFRDSTLSDTSCVAADSLSPEADLAKVKEIKLLTQKRLDSLKTKNDPKWKMDEIFSSTVQGKAISPNGDGINDRLIIQFVDGSPQNTVAIFNANGKVVFDVKGYDNTRVVFAGFGKKNDRLPPGTYFYLAEKRVDGQLFYEKNYFVLKY